MEAPTKHITVTLLTQQDCAFCEQAKKILGRFASEYALDVVTLDLATPEGQALALKGGILFPPGVFIDGEPFSYGRLSERKLHKDLERRLKERQRTAPLQS
jgi:Glutaredoxin and related proteins